MSAPAPPTITHTITPPFGYGPIAALQREDRVLLPRGSTPEFCRGVNALALSATEFTAAARDYPIAFAQSDEGRFAPVALLGLGANQNLFIDANGGWDAGCYVPAYVRRYPFCIARMANATRSAERVVCVDQAYLDPNGFALFDAAGQATQEWTQIESLLRAYEADLEQTEQMCDALFKLGLFEPFEFKVMQGETPTLTVRGVHRIDEKRFMDLRPASHKALVTKGFMGRIYAHFHSLENFSRLYQRALEAQEQAARMRKEAIQR
jgi:hypothetical protein